MFYRLCSLGIDAMTDCFIVFASGAKQARQPVPLSSRLRAPPPPFHRGSLLPGGLIPVKYILFTLVVGYFANAQYDVLFFTRHSERSEESHRVTDGAYTFHFGREIAAVAALPRNDNEKMDCRGRCAPLQ